MFRGIVCFIYAQFNLLDKFYETGSFITGHLRQLSVPIISYGLLGIYGLDMQDRTALVIYFGIALSSLFIRNLNNCLARLHGFTGPLVM